MAARLTTDIAVILPIWNGMQDLPACLAALHRQYGDEFDIVAVDNASTDGSADYISQNWPDIHLVRAKKNLGFARACNLGLEIAGNHGIKILLNQDTEVFPDWLAQLIAPIRHDSTIGIAGSKAIFPNGRIQHAGGYVDSHGVGRHFGRGERDRNQYAVLRDVDFVTGAALAITDAAFREVGPLDERFSPAYFEDVDWCFRVQNAGYRVVYVPNSVLVHKEGPTLAAADHESEFSFNTNRLRFVLKHWSLDRLVDEFMPVERRWLDSLGYRGETIIAAMHHAYLYHLVRLDEVVAARKATFPDDQAEVDGLAAVLLGLRAIYPLAPANLENATNFTPPKSPQTAFGNLLNRFRLRFPKASRSVITTPLTRPLVQLTNQQQLAEVLVEYIRENNREIGDLAQEIEMLKAELQQVKSQEIRKPK